MIILALLFHSIIFMSNITILINVSFKKDILIIIVSL